MIESVCLLLQNGYKTPEQLGLSFFYKAIETIYKTKQDDIKNIALALRIAQYAKDNDFKNFINNKADEEIEDFAL